MSIREILMPSRRDQKMLNLALKIAALSDASHRHGCVIVRSGSVLVAGINKDRNDPKYVISDEPIFSVHAEIDALSKLKDSARSTIVYVARLSKSGEAAYSRPCDNCMKALIRQGIKAVCYTTGGLK